MSAMTLEQVHMLLAEGKLITPEVRKYLVELTLAQPAQAVDVDSLAQEIRRVDGSHSLGAAALAEALTPFITRALSGEKAGPVGGWQPIETAPINETVFCYHPMVGRFPGYQSRIDGTSAVTWHNTWSQESGVMPPTHWQPLPASPAPDKEG